MTDIPAAPAAAPAPVAAPADPQDFRPVETVSLDSAPSIAAPDAPAAAIDGDEPRRLTPHAAKMAEIVAARHRVLEAEQNENRSLGLPTQPPAIGVNELLPEPPAAAPTPAGQPNAPAATAAAPTPAPAAPGAPAAPAAPVRTHRIVVGGREMELPEQDMLRAAELGVASEARLRYAQQMLEEAQRLHGAAPQPVPSAGPSPPAATPPAPQPPPSGLDRDAALEIARAIQYGDENEVAAALLRLQQPKAPAPIDPDQLAHQVHSRVGQQLRLESDLHTFASEYSDIVNDAPLTTLAAQYVHQLRSHYSQTGTPKAELAIFREAGTLVRQDVQRWTGGAAQPQPNPQPLAPTPPAPGPAGESGRLVIKRATPNAPAAAAAQPTMPAIRAPTGADIVNAMRKARGQPVYA